MNNLYETLEICLREIEQGADIDTVLFRYPNLADELRPMLEASVKAKGMAVSAPSQDVVRRNRAKLLQHAAELREGKLKPQSRRIWSVPLRRALVTLMVVAVLFASGTGLVRAASTTLPGDNLYPVKRTWEDVLLLFTFDVQKRGELELEHENERLDELNELFAEGRSTRVDFAGYVTSQNGNEWRVAGIPVHISPDTRLPVQPVVINDGVRVVGVAQNDRTVNAERIELLPSGSKLPPVNDNESEFEQEDLEDSSQQIQEDSGKGSENETPKVEATKTSESESKPKTTSVEGSVSSVKNDIIVINGITMDISLAEEVKGTLGVGVSAKVEGYYDASGIFIVTKIEFKTSDSNSGNDSNSSDDDGSDDKSVGNSNDDNGGDSNDNSGDSNDKGGDDGDNSGSGSNDSNDNGGDD